VKIEKLRKKLTDLGLDAVLITSKFNRRYISGFTGSSGFVLVTQNDAKIITDFRYVEQAENQCREFEVVEHKATIHEELANQIKTLNINQLGFEKDHVTYSNFEILKSHLKCNLVPISGVMEEIRLIKSPDEIKIVKEATSIADQAFSHILNYIKPGLSEIEVSNELEFFMRRKGATSSSFDIIVASGIRSSLPHGVATNKIIESGDFITLDFGAYFNGYVSDITRTIAVGTPNEKLVEIYNIVLEAQIKGVKGIKSGITGKEADALTRDYISQKGYGEYFGHSTGHGIGLEVHEGPNLSFRSDTILEPGMIVTVEPGIYIPDLGGVRIEDDVLVTADGYEVLTHSPKELIIL
jgi:Xaa-Pro aminopeptidase